MKILLMRHHDIENINTRLPESLNRAQGMYPPLGISYIAAVLEKAGHETRILDSQALNLTTEETKKEIEKYMPDIVGINCMTPNVRGALEAARLAKEVSKDIITVLGGPQLSVFPEETVSFDFVDFGVCGEGEFPMLQLAEHLEKNKQVSAIKGLIYKKDGKVFSNPTYIVENLDELPFPARHLLPMEKYHCVITKQPFTTMIAGRGCPFRCGFCFKGPSDQKVRIRSYKSVVDEMEECVEKYKVKEIMFYDDTFTFNKKYVENICNEIIKRGLKVSWECPTRVDTVDEGILKLMKKAGCIRLRFGVESGNPEILKLMRKNINLKQIEKIFRLARKIGFERFAYFIIGYMNETEKTMQDTINFAKKIDPGWVMFTVATPLPNTNLFDLAVEKGLIDKEYWRKFTLGETDERLPYLVKDADVWAKKAYREFYLRPQFFLNKLLAIDSFDKIKKYWKGLQGILSFEMRE